MIMHFDMPMWLEIKSIEETATLCRELWQSADCSVSRYARGHLRNADPSRAEPIEKQFETEFAVIFTARKG